MKEFRIKKIVFVFGIVSLCKYGRIDLRVLQRGTINNYVYRDGIHRTYVHLYTDAIGNDFLVQEEDARLHLASIIEDYLQHQKIQPMSRSSWPVTIPDLNTFEHNWVAIGKYVAVYSLPFLIFQLLYQNYDSHFAANVSIV